jgi:hypothetical protein
LAALVLTAALQRTCFVVLDLAQYRSERALLEKFAGRSQSYFLDFVIGHTFRDADFQLACFLYMTGIVIGCITMHFARTERKAEQERRDKLAQRIAVEVEHCIATNSHIRKAPAFVLYLRPFALEKTIRGWKLIVSGFKMFFLESGNMNFDYFLQDNLNYLDMPLISIGLPDDQEGAGRVTTDDMWYERFERLAAYATAIFVVPGFQKGIKAEIRWLRSSGLLTNVVFFKPKRYPRTAWQEMKEFYEKEDGIEFPDYSSKHLSFRIHSSGKCYDLLTWPNLYRGAMGKLGKNRVRSLLANTPASND